MNVSVKNGYLCACACVRACVSACMHVCVPVYAYSLSSSVIITVEIAGATITRGEVEVRISRNCSVLSTIASLTGLKG